MKKIDVLLLLLLILSGMVMGGLIGRLLHY